MWYVHPCGDVSIGDVGASRNVFSERRGGVGRGRTGWDFGCYAVTLSVALALALVQHIITYNGQQKIERACCCGQPA
jgi:hypothetical protein